MIIQTGMRTDIPAFYSKWFLNRIKEGYVCVRNPYNPKQVTKYSLSPEVVDLIAFCTKNPLPMLPFLDELKPYGQYWFVTITPYGRDIEPNVPDKETVMEGFKELSDVVGADSMGWRYDPTFIDKKHSVEWHISEFEKMAEILAGYTKTCVISFIDIYKKVERNFPEAKSVRAEDRAVIGKAFVKIASKYGMVLKLCAEGEDLAKYGADCSGCMTVHTFETEESKMVMSALAESMAWQTGSVISTRLSKTSCRSSKKSCLKRVILEASGTLVKPQKSRRGFE